MYIGLHGVHKISRGFSADFLVSVQRNRRSKHQPFGDRVVFPIKFDGVIDHWPSTGFRGNGGIRKSLLKPGSILKNFVDRPRAYAPAPSHLQPLRRSG